jgi:hypothetical protein
LKNLIVYCSLLLAFNYQTVTSKETINPVKDEVVEFKIRAGLPNFNSKASKGDSVRVAYLGGSITVQNGWRVLSFDFNILKRSFESMILVNRTKFQKHPLPEPIAADCFSNTYMIDINKSMLTKNWQIIQTAGQSEI